MTASNPIEINEISASLDPDAYQEFVDRLSLRSVETIAIRAERFIGGPTKEVQFSTAGSIGRNETDLIFKYDVVATIVAESGETSGKIEASVLLVFEAQDDPVPTDEMLAFFGGTSGSLIVHPFLREVTTDAAAKIGYPGVAMPLQTARPRSLLERPESRGKEGPGEN